MAFARTNLGIDSIDKAQWPCGLALCLCYGYCNVGERNYPPSLDLSYSESETNRKTNRLENFAACSRPSAFALNAVKVHEPRLEERTRHRLQRLVHPPVQLDLVVQRAEDVEMARCSFRGVADSD